jgi:hypothetical protein
MQVDLNTSSIRPGKSREWLDALRQNIQHSVRVAAELGVTITAHTGSWEHDVAQVCPYPRRPLRRIQYLVESIVDLPYPETHNSATC